MVRTIWYRGTQWGLLVFFKGCKRELYKPCMEFRQTLPIWPVIPSCIHNFTFRVSWCRILGVRSVKFSYRLMVSVTTGWNRMLCGALYNEPLSLSWNCSEYWDMNTIEVIFQTQQVVWYPVMGTLRFAINCWFYVARIIILIYCLKKIILDANLALLGYTGN